VQSNTRDPKVCYIRFVTIQLSAPAEGEPSIDIAIFREEPPYAAPNLPQPIPAFLCRMKIANGTVWRKAYWNGRSYVPSSYIKEPTVFCCNGHIETITLSPSGKYLARDSAVNDDIAIPVDELDHLLVTKRV